MPRFKIEIVIDINDDETKTPDQWDWDDLLDTRWSGDEIISVNVEQEK